jgi:hypothetical protein
VLKLNLGAEMLTIKLSAETFVIDLGAKAPTTNAIVLKTARVSKAKALDSKGKDNWK